MLQQILRDLYVDPEILAELDDQQKQTLFCKMREEQVRRWKLWDQKEAPTENSPCTKWKKTVTFMQGIDGEPWVWVMGEHENDKSIEEILKEEAVEKARRIAEKETEELRKQVEATLSDYIDLSTEEFRDIRNEDEDIYCSVEELKDKRSNKINGYTLGHYQSRNKYNLKEPRDVLQEISLNSQKVSQKIMLWEKRMTEERTTEILKSIQKKQMEQAKEAEEAEKKQDVLWREQERKAKHAEQQIREIARRAREEHRQASGLELDVDYVMTGVPPGKQAVLDWYKDKELLRMAGLNSFNKYEPWFHGLITRSEAERRLQDQSDGTFLVRLSEKIWGYAISYRAKIKCKHYLVSASQKYSFLGNNQMEHRTLGDLIEYHKEYSLSGGEKLLIPCDRSDGEPVLEVK